MNIGNLILKRPVWISIALVAIFGVVASGQSAPKRVTRSEAMNAVASKVPPEYPRMAIQLKIQGSVELEAYVGESGEVTRVQIVSGNPLLTAAAADALKRWKFKPFLDDGKAIAVVAPITLDFKI